MATNVTETLTKIFRDGSTKAADYLNLSTESDITEVIKEDHKPLKELIKTLKNADASIEERKEAFEEFAYLLIAHAKPEEEVLYTVIKSDKEIRAEGMEGDVEHILAEQMIDETRRATNDDLWTARSKVLAELVEHHIQEEESSLLPDFKKHSDPQERRRMGQEFLKLKLDYLAAGENVIPDPKTETEQTNELPH